MSRTVDHLILWNDEKQQKLSKLRDVEKQREVVDVQEAPQISRQSISLFSNRQDEIAKCKVEDRLHLLGLIYDYQREERLLQQLQRDTSSKSHVAPHSARLVRSRQIPTHERLHAMAKRHTQSEDQSSIQHKIRPSIGKQVGVSVEERLAQFGEQYRKKKRGNDATPRSKL